MAVIARLSAVAAVPVAAAVLALSVPAVPGELFAFLRDSVREKRIAEVDIRGSRLGQGPYRDAPAEGCAPRMSR